VEVRVKFYGNYRRLVDGSEVTLELGEGANLLQLVASLAERCGERLRAALICEDRGGVRLQSGVRIALGEEIIDSAGDLRKPLPPSASRSERPIEVFVIPSIMGGSS
jgi:molybdopterin converting factor small subunit